MRLLPLFLLTAAAPHSGQVVRDGFELSDVALFFVAAGGVWLALRSLRRRAGKHR